jgi:DNA-binding CsgD family transcriptional regulator/tetratricopeptide (TPR) repeat protein
MANPTFFLIFSMRPMLRPDEGPRTKRESLSVTDRAELPHQTTNGVFRREDADTAEARSAHKATIVRLSTTLVARGEPVPDVQAPLVADVPGRSDDLLERAGQLAVLEEALASVGRDRRGAVALICGEAGVGKTALVRSFGDGAARPQRVLWGTCDPLFTPRPFGPLLAIGEGTGGDLGTALSEGANPHQVALALARELSSPAPALLVLEDLHWADEATLDVFMLLVRRAEAAPTLVVGTYRDDALENAHPLRRVLGEVATTTAVRRMKLAPLSPDAVGQLAAPHGVDGRELYEKTGGNPFFVVEVLAGDSEDIPATVNDAVLARAMRLSPSARQLLEAAAVVPQRAELWLLQALAGSAVEAVDECVTAGMLVADGDAVVFRHELARLSLESSVGPGRKAHLHRQALSAISGRPGHALDFARLAHHAEAAGDTDAVVRFALPAAERASSMGAHREAAAQYARVVRFGAGLPLEQRADVLERRSHECYLTDQSDEAIAALEEALECRRALGDRLGQGRSLSRLGEMLWCPGRAEESRRAAREAIAVLEPLPASRELAKAYASLATKIADTDGWGAAGDWGKRALRLAEDLGDTETALDARRIVACELPDGELEAMEQILEDAQRAGLVEQVGGTYLWLFGAALGARRYNVAEDRLAKGVEYCSDHGLELFRLYLLSHRARLYLDQGRWAEAAETADVVLRIPRTSISPRITALTVLGLVRARRGDPGHGVLLDEAWDLARPTGEVDRLGPVAAARAEAAWLGCDPDGVASVTELALALALRCGSALWERHGSPCHDLADELGVWRRRAGLGAAKPTVPGSPHGLLLAGCWDAARVMWVEAGCPYEAALCLADADDEARPRLALDELLALEGRPAAAIVARRLRDRGVMSLPRGPRTTTRQNQYGLTAREVEVLALLKEGLQNSQIARRLVVSVKTVEHHVEAILRKLGARTRADARATATSLAKAVAAS